MGALIAGTDKWVPAEAVANECEPVESGTGVETIQAGKCSRCGSPGLPPHSCPYQSDINGDYETLCGCCEGCMDQCAMDI